MTEITAKTPWEGSMGGIPMHLDYFDGSMFEAVERIAKKYPRNVAFDFMGRPTTYARLVDEIRNCARALRTIEKERQPRKSASKKRPMLKKKVVKRRVARTLD